MPAKFVAIVLIIGAGAAFALPTPATIIFRVVDLDGKPRDYKIASLHPVGHPEVELSDKVKGMVFDEAELGRTYECLVAPVKPRSGSTTIAKVTASSPHAVAVIAIGDADIDYIGPMLNRFVVKPVPPRSDELTWVVVKRAFSTENESVESAVVDRNGGFTLAGLHGGSFLMTLYRGSKVLGTKLVEIPLVGSKDLIELGIN
jgi:hypothetical protein